MANAYEMGDTIRLSFEFRVNGVLTDPAEVTVKVKKPDGTVVPYTGGQVTRDGVGLYHVDVVGNQHGVWDYRGEGTGAAAGAGESSFVVKHSVFS